MCTHSIPHIHSVRCRSERINLYKVCLCDFTCQCAEKQTTSYTDTFGFRNENSLYFFGGFVYASHVCECVCASSIQAAAFRDRMHGSGIINTDRAPIQSGAALHGRPTVFGCGRSRCVGGRTHTCLRPHAYKSCAPAHSAYIRCKCHNIKVEGEELPRRCAPEHAAQRPTQFACVCGVWSEHHYLLCIVHKHTHTNKHVWCACLYR